MPHHQSITVPYHYDVHFEERLKTGPKSPLMQSLDPDRPVLTIIDRGVAKAHPELKAKMKKNFGIKPLLVKGGEAIKNDPSIVDTVGRAILKHKLCRHSTVVIIGGGAVLDAVGYAAAVTHRGMRQVRIPTTVLSQNDSGIGVKNGINAFGLKNYYGTFAPPSAVINCAEFLKTLSNRDWRGGISEAFKVAIIKDKAFFTWLCDNATKLKARNMRAMKTLVHRCALLHLDHIAQGGDPFEFGASRPLDFGHWSAHKLEGLTHNRLRHGEAVAIGIALDSLIASELGYLSEENTTAIIEGLQNCGLNTWHKELANPAVIKGIQEFREHIGGELCLTLPDGIGAKLEIHDLDTKLVKKAIKQLKSR